MKKLFSVVIVILCASMLTMSFSAAETPDAYSLYKLAAKHMKEATSLELITASKAVSERAEYVMVESKSTTTTKRVRSADGTLQMEEHTIYPDEYSSLNRDAYYKDGYSYERSDDYRTRSKVPSYETVAPLYSLGLEFNRNTLMDLTVEALPGGGYKLRFKTEGSGGDSLRFSDTVYIMTLSSDARLETVASAYTFWFLDDGKVKDKIKFNEGTRVLSVNQPLKLNFPPDLNNV